MRKILAITILTVALSFIIVGSIKRQPKDVENVGSVMCLSCMGLQQ
ncbi:MAG: hypothetical protein NZ601_02360 [candidate division WOR-3 bacterium]|nr:hypothetical protein [candidate division WOR-3 bacterium]MDW7987769.1 hypothetical protein [candidate division WOR-3 bacterium]